MRLNHRQWGRVVEGYKVKYLSGDRVHLRRIHSNSKGYVVKPQRENAYDWLYILKKDGRQYLIDRCLARRSYNPREEDLLGGMAERTNALVLKTRGGKTPVGSNPTTPAL